MKNALFSVEAVKNRSRHGRWHAGRPGSGGGEHCLTRTTDVLSARQRAKAMSVFVLSLMMALVMMVGGLPSIIQVIVFSVSMMTGFIIEVMLGGENDEK